MKQIILNNEESNYTINKNGIVKGKRGIIKPIKWASGKYYMYSFNHRGSKIRILVHRLVALYCLDNVPSNNEELTVNHKNGNGHDNRPSNLEWLSREDNIKHAYETGLSKGECFQKIRAFNDTFSKDYPSLSLCAKELNVNPGNIHYVLKYNELGENRQIQGYRFVKIS